jgi:hypothetical protein
MKVYTFSRQAIVTETYIIEADTEAEAFAQARRCNVPPDRTEFVDWYEDDFTLESANDAEEATP